MGRVFPTVINSETEQNYNYNDLAPFKGINYYRLKIVDLDGSFEYSRVVSVFVKDNNNNINIFPNPATTHVELAGMSSKSTIVRLMSVSGRTINVQQLRDDNRINVNRLPSGTYYMEITEKGKRPVVKQFIRK